VVLLQLRLHRPQVRRRVDHGKPQGAVTFGAALLVLWQQSFVPSRPPVQSGLGLSRSASTIQMKPNFARPIALN